MQGNGKTTWLIWLAGALLSIMLAVLTILSTGVIANENRNVAEHRQMIEERKRDILIAKQEIDSRYSEAMKEISAALNLNTQQHLDIISRLSRIEALAK